MSKIITVTLHPSLDRTLVLNFLNVGYDNRIAEPTRLLLGGQGVTVSRAIHALNIPNRAVILLGDDPTAAAYRLLLSRETLPVDLVEVEGFTRSNVTLLDVGNHTETRLIEGSSLGADEDLIQVNTKLEEIVETGDTVLLAGSLPTAMTDDAYLRLTRTAREAGARVMISSHGDPLKRAMSANPDVIALRLYELEGMVNYPVRTPEAAIGAAREIIKRGVGEVLVTMFNDDTEPIAAYATAEDAWIISAPATKNMEGTATGMRDALIAGLLSGLQRGDSMENALLLAAAAATYTATQVGSVFGEMEAVRDFMARVEVKHADRT